jgi:hypothetical protein
MSSMQPDPRNGVPDQALRDEQRIGALLRAAQSPAPAALHERVAELLAAAARQRRRRRASVLAPAGAFAVAVVALVVVLGTGTIAAPPSTLRVARLALADSSAPAPARLLAAGTAIVFPHWQHWPSAGMRSDQLDGRTVTTAFYGSYPAGRIGYAIVSGAPLGPPPGADGVKRSGERYWLSSSAGARVVSWVQEGHSCVLASRSAPANTLLALAVAQDRPVALAGRAAPA